MSYPLALVRRPSVLFSLLAFAICAWLAPPAMGQDVQTDPDSPSESEYQIPLESERDDASSDDGEPNEGNAEQKDGDDGDQKKGDDRSAPLFGEGVENGGSDASSQTSDDDADYGDTAVATGGSDDEGGSGNGRDDAAAAANKRADRRERRRNDDSAPASVGAQPTTAATADAGSDGLPLALGLGAFVLVLGAGVGYVLRRRGARPVDDSAG